MPTTPSVVLLGPAASGKSTLGELIAQELSVEFVDLDDVGDAYYDEVGWSIARLIGRTEAVGRVAAEQEWEKARAHAVVRAMAEYPGTVVALGAGHASYTQARYALQTANALAPVEHVLYVEPCSDRERSLQILRERSILVKGTDWIRESHDFLAQWLDDPLSRKMATATLYTAGETPQQTASRFIGSLRRQAGEPTEHHVAINAPAASTPWVPAADLRNEGC